jgi:hypothetical protein
MSVYVKSSCVHGYASVFWSSENRRVYLDARDNSTGDLQYSDVSAEKFLNQLCGASEAAFSHRRPTFK